MAVTVTEVAGGSQTATIGTAHTLTTITTAGIYELHISLGNLAAGDVLELRVYSKCRNATDPEELLQIAIYGPVVPICKLVNAIVTLSSGHYKAELIQRAGTGRAWPWAVKQA